MLVPALGIDDVNRLLASPHPLDEEGIDDGPLLGEAVDERAGVEVVTKLRMGKRGGERHARKANNQFWVTACFSYWGRMSSARSHFLEPRLPLKVSRSLAIASGQLPTARRSRLANHLA